MTAVDMYRDAVEKVPAYRDFLTKKLGAIPTVETMEDFERLPMISKGDYIMEYPVPELCLDGTTSCAHLWLRSSGTSRKPFFWPRRYEDEKTMPQGLSKLFHRYVSPEAQPTLIVVGLALGPWGTGMQSSYLFRSLAHDVPGLAVVSPGLQNDSIIEVFERICPMYKQTLFLCYPPFAKMVLEEAAERGIDLPSLNIHLMVGGEGVTEAYRERMWKLLGHSENDLDTVWSLYGSTDFANVGFENVLTIAARRLMLQNNLFEKVLGEPDMPMLFQRVPTQTHFEEVDGELVISRIQGIPLIRYRTGDHVRFIERDELLARLREAGCDAEQAVRDAGLEVPEWKTPFVALYGRIDQVVFFYGAKITVDQVKTALDSAAMTPYFNGRFLMRGIESEKGDPMLEVSLEQSEALNTANLDEVADIFAQELDKVQSEFRQVRTLKPGIQHVRIVAAETQAFELGWKTRHM
jgi:phenylacetate-CoA ligase